MHLLIIFRIAYVAFIFLCTTSSTQIEKIEFGMLSTNDANIPIVINGSATDCLCQALMNSTAVVAINYFSNNQSCQFFSSYASAYQVQVNSMSTLFLIEPLPITPSCTNLTWLLDASKF
jgi:hypothetical protein